MTTPTPFSSAPRVRLATADDREAVLRLAIRFMGESHYARLMQPNVEALDTLIAFLLTSDNGALFVLDVGGQVAGMVGMTVVPNHLSGELQGSEVAFYVEPDYRRGRAALRLLDAAEQWAVDQGARALQMIAPPGSMAGTLYERRGYQVLETVWTRRVDVVDDVAEELAA